jgi:serine/threonine protein kinase
MGDLSTCHLNVPIDRDDGGQEPPGLLLLGDDAFDSGASLSRPAVRMHFVVSWFVDGEDLMARFCRAGALGEAELVRIACGLLQGLIPMHRCGLVHGDVKPENVLLAHVTVVVDFGLSRPIGAIDAIGGTELYRAPEADPPAPMFPPRDVWAAGVTLFALAAGQEPYWEGEEITNWPPAMSGWLRRIIARMLVPDDADRAAAEDVLDALAQRL